MSEIRLKKGYAFLDVDQNISFRDAEYIDKYDPGFWGRNAHSIDIYWKFDQEIPESMKSLMESFKRRQLPALAVKEFCKAIGFDLDRFLEENRSVPKTFSTPDSLDK